MREKIGKKGIARRLFSVILAFAIVTSMLPAMTLTAAAAAGFDLRNGSGISITKPELTEGSSTDSRGYTFAGWYTGLDGTGTELATGATGDIGTIYYAKWTKDDKTVLTQPIEVKSGGVFIGGSETAANTQELKKYGITYADSVLTLDGTVIDTFNSDSCNVYLSVSATICVPTQATIVRRGSGSTQNRNLIGGSNSVSLTLIGGGTLNVDASNVSGNNPTAIGGMGTLSNGTDSQLPVTLKLSVKGSAYALTVIYLENRGVITAIGAVNASDIKLHEGGSISSDTSITGKITINEATGYTPVTVDGSGKTTNKKIDQPNKTYESSVVYDSYPAVSGGRVSMTTGPEVTVTKGGVEDKDIKTLADAVALNDTNTVVTLNRAPAAFAEAKDLHANVTIKTKGETPALTIKNSNGAQIAVSGGKLVLTLPKNATVDLNGATYTGMEDSATLSVDTTSGAVAVTSDPANLAITLPKDQIPADGYTLPKDVPVTVGDYTYTAKNDGIVLMPSTSGEPIIVQPENTTLNIKKGNKDVDYTTPDDTAASITNTVFTVDGDSDKVVYTSTTTPANTNTEGKSGFVFTDTKPHTIDGVTYTGKDGGDADSDIEYTVTHGATANSVAVTGDGDSVTVKFNKNASVKSGEDTYNANAGAELVITKTADGQTVTAGANTTLDGSDGVYECTASTHNWTYSENGATLTATCDGSCGSTSHDVTLTLSATSPNYSGSPYTGASLSDTTAWEDAGLTVPTINYAGRNGTEYTTLETAPTDVGTYTASVTVYESASAGGEGGGISTGNTAKTASADFTIDKASAAVGTAPTGFTNLTYSADTAQALAAAGTAGTGADKLQYSLSESGAYADAIPTATDVDDYTVWYKAIADESGNYKDSEPASVSAKINGLDFTAGDVTASFYDGIYDGTAHGITITLTGTAEGGTVTYSTAANGEYSAAPITKTDADTYTVYYKVAKTGYNPATGSSIITINPKEVTAEDITVTAPTSNGSDLTDSVTVKLGDTTLVKGTDYDVTYDPAVVKEAGEYKATFTFKGNYSGTVENKTFTVSQRSSSRSSGGSSSAPSTPSVTVPVSGDQHSVDVSATVSGSTATVKELSSSELAKVTGDENVEIDLTGLKKEIDTAKLPAATVEKIAEQSGITVKLNTATVAFDDAATQAISDQAKGNTIEIKIDEANKNTLTAAQKSAIEGLGSQIIVEATVISNGVKISDFKGGSAEVSIPYTLKNNQKANGLVVYFVADDGSVEKIPATYADGKVVFTVSHFSHYVVAYDETLVTDSTPATDEDSFPFVDVTEGDFFYNAVKWAVENGITSGTDATHFSPNMGTTRAQVVTFLWRAAGSPAVAANGSFSDVVSGSYYEQAVAWAVANGITKGTGETTFSPDAVCTRAQIVTFLYRYNKADTLNIKHNPFTDVTEEDYFYNAVLWAVEREITQGTSATTFSPNEDCTRAQIVTFLYRFISE